MHPLDFANLANLKPDADELDIAKLKNVPRRLSNLKKNGR